MASLLWLLVGLWMAGILYTSSLGQAVTPVTGIVQTIVAKLGHILEYAILGLLILVAARTEPSVRNSIRWQLLVVGLIGGLFAVFDELRQSFSPGREPRVTDVLLDLVSLLVAGWLGGRWLGRASQGALLASDPPADQPRGE